MAKKILILDESGLNEYAAECLRDCGFRVTISTTGANAVETVRRVRPDLVITVIQITEEEYDVVRAIRSAQDIQDTPVAILSPRVGASELVRALNSDIAFCLEMPYLSGDLTRFVRRFFQALERESEEDD